MTALHLVQNVIIHGVANTEVLLLRIRLVGTQNLVQRARAVRNGQREASRVGLSLDVRRHLEGVSGENLGGRSADDAGVGIERHSVGQIGGDRATSESERLGGDEGVLAVAVVRVRRLLEGDRADGRLVAHEELKLVDIHVGRVRAKRIQTDGLEAVSSTQTIPLLPGVFTVHVVAGHHQRRVRSRLGSGALNGEVADGILVVGVDPKAEGVNHGNGRSRELEGKRTRNGTGSGSTIATPVVSVRRGRKARGSHCSRRGDDVTVVRGRLSGEEGQEGVELDRGRGGVTEVELHSQHAAGGLRDRCRTDDSVVGVASVASRGRSRGRDVSGRHVVSVDFDSIDVGDHSELVLELQIDGGHTRHTREGLAEVLGFICDICVDRGCDLSGGIGLVTLNEVCNNLTIVICARYGDANLIMSTIVAMNAVTGTNKYIYSTRILQFTSIAQFCHNEPTRNLPLLRIMSIL